MSSPSPTADPPLEWLQLFAEKTVERIDTDAEFRLEVTYRLSDGRTYKNVPARIVKTNPFIEDRGVIDIDMCDGTGFQQRHESTLIKSVGSIDNENEFTAWVECRLPGTDQLVHRSASTWLKRTPEMGAAQGTF